MAGPSVCPVLDAPHSMEDSSLRPTTAMARGPPQMPWNRGRRRESIGSFPQPVFKILFIGDSCTGKTSLVQRYAYDAFSERHQSTIGADYASRTIGWTVNVSVRLQLWDISGQDRFSALTRPFYRHADAAFVVFDASRSETFRSALAWKADLDDKVRMPCGATIPCVLLANKCDLPEKEAFVNEGSFMDAWTMRHGFRGWLRTSAKDDVGVDEAMECLLMNLMDGAVHRRVDDLGERRYDLLRDDEVACACMREEGKGDKSLFIGPREYPVSVRLKRPVPQAQAADSKCPCW